MKSISERVDKLIKEGEQLQIRLGNQWIDFDGENFELLKFHRADIREKPEKEFILGDWWLPWPKAKPEKLTAENINYYNGTRPYAQNTEVKLWTPQLGEWCWFGAIEDNYGILAQYGTYHHEHSGNYEDVYDRCEPFTGTLPTFLKDN